MTVSKWLRRVSAVCWSFLAIFFTLLLATDFNNSEFTPLMPIGAYALHRVTCWVLKRFFGDGN